MAFIDLIFIFLFGLSVFNILLTIKLIKKEKSLNKVDDNKKIIEAYEKYIESENELTSEYLKYIKGLVYKLFNDNRIHFDNKSMFDYENNKNTKETLLKTNSSSRVIINHNSITTKSRIEMKHKSYRKSKNRNTRRLKESLEKLKHINL